VWLKQILPGEYLKLKLESTFASLSANSQQQQILTIESAEVLTSLMKDSDTVTDYQVLILSLNDKNYDCPGMMNEEKVLREFEASQLVMSKNKTASRCNKHGHGSKNQHTLKVTCNLSKKLKEWVSLFFSPFFFVFLPIIVLRTLEPDRRDLQHGEKIIPDKVIFFKIDQI